MQQKVLLKLAKEISRCSQKLGISTDILLEVNIGREENKSGVSYSELDALAEAAANAANLDWRGLMTMAPLTPDASKWKEAFSKLAAARSRLEKKLNVLLPELSMGMSGDFAEAVACGSTMIRIGSRLFGGRNYNK